MNGIDLRRDLGGLGTPEETWQRCSELNQLARWRPRWTPRGKVVVVAPHPDDEILGIGGTVALLTHGGCDVLVVAVTDGEASHPSWETDLRSQRRRESDASFDALGISPAVARLELPDGAVREDEVATSLRSIVAPHDLILAPWVFDGHPDHEAAGRGSVRAAKTTGARLLSYLVWAWHWASPDDLPWRSCVRVDLGVALAQRKQLAVRCFESQLQGCDPVLTPSVVERLTRPFEVLVAP